METLELQSVKDIHLSFKRPYNCHILANKLSGKTAMVKYMITVTKPDSVIVVQTDTDELTDELKDMNYTITSDLQPFIDTAKLRRRQEMNGLGVRKNITVWIRSHKLPPSFLRSPTLQELLMNGRLYGVSVIMEGIDATAVPPSIRAQFDLVFTRKLMTDALYRNYGLSILGKINDLKALTQSLDDGVFLVIANDDTVRKTTISSLESHELEPYYCLPETIFPPPLTQSALIKKEIIRIRSELTSLIDLI